MKCCGFCLAVMLASVLVGYSSSPRRAHAAVPQICKNFQCKTINAHWVAGGANGTVRVALQPGSVNNSEEGIENIFTPSSTDMSPLNKNGTMDMWEASACSPQCGMVNNVWQAPQEVSHNGDLTINPFGRGVTRNVCKTNNGNQGPTTTVGNNNPGGSVPPQ